MDSKSAIRDRLAALLESFHERYGLALSDLTWQETPTGLVVSGTVAVLKQLVQLRKSLDDWDEESLGPAPALQVDVLAQLPRDDPRAPFRAAKPDQPVPLFSRSGGDTLATEWIPTDGPARVLAEGPGQVLLQLIDGSCGWATSERVNMVESVGETGPFVLAIPPNRTVRRERESVSQLCSAARALAEQRVTYKLGGRTLDDGLDCSAFVQHLLHTSLGVLFPRHSGDQMKRGTRVARANISQGDLVFARTMERNHMHVGLALGSDEIAHACRLDGFAKVEGLDSFFQRYRFLKGRRLVLLTDG